MSKFLDGNPIDFIIDENKKLELGQQEPYSLFLLLLKVVLGMAPFY